MEQFYLSLFIVVYAIGAIYAMVFAIRVVQRTPAQPWIMALFVIGSGIFWWVYLGIYLSDRARDKYG